jgi:hypothetical protein
VGVKLVSDIKGRAHRLRAFEKRGVEENICSEDECKSSRLEK